MIALDALTLRFGGLVALDAISARFTAPVSGIIGPNGAGKTTTMNVMSGFLTPASGRVLVDGTDLLALPPHRRTRWGLRRSFQREQIADDLTVWENILAITDNLPLSRSARRAEAAAAMEVAGITALRATPGAALNSFERRLTDLARCLAGRPRVILLDEPAGGLTPDETARLGDLILRLPQICGAQVLVIDHDVDLITRICADTLVLDFGRRIAFGPTRAVLDDPAVKAAYLGVDHA
ncbi:ATP-binding cassette domain-containing protein [Gemmobacter fulvus]|uniref:ABC transporter ATP-binding protein n=1 Tax=Gemmobacter fulvus TaxID=2840474 RepID=UPI0027965B32|nr:ATP-binding cassette domain-containing protein [Gemmobacter fulvus]MDQ1850231.1 ATP-binding cassette domain-containing protein [Gemmobacter fulvus]